MAGDTDVISLFLECNTIAKENGLTLGMENGSFTVLKDSGVIYRHAGIKTILGFIKGVAYVYGNEGR